MATLKEFEEALKAAGNTAALEILDSLRARDRAQRSVRPARRLTGRKMTPELAGEILHLHETTNMTQQEIAFQLGVNQGRVNEVIKRRKWLTDDPDAPEAQDRDKAKQRAKEGVGVAPRRPSRRKAAQAEPAPADAQPEEPATEGGAQAAVPDAPIPDSPVAAAPVSDFVAVAQAEPQQAPEPAAEPPLTMPLEGLAVETVPAGQLEPTGDKAKDKPQAKAPPRKRGKAADAPAQLLFKDLL
ncbi:hypothetical protein AZL_d00660 (plasmid) [Azospirillum sp. B510]|nr:hypothetical protein AZL_d00660 [Azospirillum sp. B510]